MMRMDGGSGCHGVRHGARVGACRAAASSLKSAAPARIDMLPRAMAAHARAQEVPRFVQPPCVGSCWPRDVPQAQVIEAISRCERCRCCASGRCSSACSSQARRPNHWFRKEPRQTVRKPPDTKGKEEMEGATEEQDEVEEQRVTETETEEEEEGGACGNLRLVPAWLCGSLRIGCRSSVRTRE